MGERVLNTHDVERELGDAMAPRIWLEKIAEEHTIESGRTFNSGIVHKASGFVLAGILDNVFSRKQKPLGLNMRHDTLMNWAKKQNFPLDTNTARMLIYSDRDIFAAIKFIGRPFDLYNDVKAINSEGETTISLTHQDGATFEFVTNFHQWQIACSHQNMWFGQQEE